jgi:hypothetical protein
MTAAREAAARDHVDVLILESPTATYVVLASDVASIGSSADQGRAAQTEPADESDRPIPLHIHLDAGAVGPQPGTTRCLVVACGKHFARFSTTAHLRLGRLPQNTFFRMPRLLREAGCRDWVCGVALVAAPEAGVDAGPTRLAIWIDPRQLGTACRRGGRTT